MKRSFRSVANFLAVQRNFILLLCVLSGVGIAFALLATRWGAALSDNSYFYVKPARDILAGRAPLFSSHYPPFLPLLVTLISLPGIEPLLAIRLLNAVLFGISIFLTGQIVWKLTGLRGIALAGAFLFMISQVMLEIHAWAMSEALFICVCFFSILAFAVYARTYQWRWLVVTALLAGCAALSRYAGISLILSLGLVFLLLPQPRWMARVGRALAFGGIAGGMFALYILGYSLALHEWSQYGGIRFAMLDVPEIREAFYNILLWLMPGRLARGREILLMGGLLGGGVLLIAAYGLVKKQAFRCNLQTIRQQPLFALLALLPLANLFMLYQAHINPYYRSPFDTRLLSPSHAILIVLVVSLLGLVWKHNGLVLKLGILLAFVWMTFLYLPRSIDYIAQMREHGAGFGTPYWAELDAARFINNHPTSSMVTTAPYAVYFATGKEIRGITPLNPNQLRDYLREQNRYLVVFQSMPLDMYGYPAEEFLKGMVVVDEYSDCIIYQVSP